MIFSAASSLFAPALVTTYGLHLVRVCGLQQALKVDLVTHGCVDLLNCIAWAVGWWAPRKVARAIAVLTNLCISNSSVKLLLMQSCEGEFVTRACKVLQMNHETVKLNCLGLIRTLAIGSHAYPCCNPNTCGVAPCTHTGRCTSARPRCTCYTCT